MIKVLWEIGTTRPAGELQVASSDTTSAFRGISSSQFSTSVHAALLNLQKARGTQDSPLTVANGDAIGAVNFFGFGTSYLPVLRSLLRSTVQ